MHHAFRFLLGVLFLFASYNSTQASQSTSDKSQSSGVQAPAPQETPSISIPENTYDFGEIVEGGDVTHDFVVKNNGKAPLEINQVRPG